MPTQKGERMIYYIADTHFGHENVIGFCNRPFADIEEMNRVMVANWNERVKGNDTVYVLGDMFFRCKDPESILRQLKGKKRLLVGNHDGSWMTMLDVMQYFESVDSLLETAGSDCGLTLCHYPLLTWRHQKKTYMIHGHIHNDTSEDYWPLIKARERVLNAGVDINGFKPVTLEELIANNNAFKALH
jgi:calcineurin-like phosphoesterase family protein